MQMQQVIDKIFELNKQEDILEFIKQYAQRDEQFTEALSLKFVPQNAPSKKEIQDKVNQCFIHKRYSMNVNEYMTEYNWDLIIDDLLLVMKKVEYLFENNRLDEAIELCVALLEKLGETYMEDTVFEDQDYDDISFTFYPFSKVLYRMLSSKHSDTELMTSFIERIDILKSLEPYNSYLPIIPSIGNTRFLL